MTATQIHQEERERGEERMEGMKRAGYRDEEIKWKMEESERQVEE